MRNQIQDIHNAIAALRPFVQAKAYIAVLEELKKLAEAYKCESYLDADKLSKADEAAEILRGSLRKAMILESGSSLPKSYFDAIFKVQMLLALYWPCNGRESNGYPSDPLDNCDGLSPKMLVVAVSGGHLYVKSALKDFCQRGFGRETNAAGQPCFVTPLREVLTERDVDYLKEKGFIFPDADAVIDYNNVEPGPAEENNEANNAQPEPELINNPRHNLNIPLFLFQSLGQFYHREDENRLEAHARAMPPMGDGLIFSMIAAATIGATAAVVGVMAVTNLFLPLLTMPGLIAVAALAGGALFGKLIHIAMENEVDQMFKAPIFMRILGTTLVALTAGVIGVGLLALAAPYVIMGLVASSIISTSVAASVSASLGIIQIALPSVLGVIGLTKEYFRSGAMSQFLESIVLTPIVLTAAVGAGLGAGIYSLTQSLLQVFGLRRNPPPPPPPPPVGAENVDDDDHNHNPLLHANRGLDPVINPALVNAGQNQADIYRGLGLNGGNIQAPADPVVEPEPAADLAPPPEEVAALEAIVDAADREEELKQEAENLPAFNNR